MQKVGDLASSCTERPVIRDKSLEFLPFIRRCVLGSSSQHPTLCSAGATTHATYHWSLHDICYFLSHNRFLSPPNRKPSMSNCLVMSSSCPPSACIHVTSHLRDQTLTQVDYPTEIRPSPSWTSSRNFLWARLKAKVPVKTGLLCSLAACRCSSATEPKSLRLHRLHLSSPSTSTSSNWCHSGWSKNHSRMTPAQWSTRFRSDSHVTASPSWSGAHLTRHSINYGAVHVKYLDSTNVVRRNPSHYSTLQLYVFEQTC